MAIIEVWLIHLIFEMPDSMIPNDPDSVAEHLGLIPLGAKGMVVLSQFAGAFVASLVAGRISLGIRKAALTAGGIMVLFTVMNLISISHPAWMSVTMPIAAVLGVLAGSKNFA